LHGNDFAAVKDAEAKAWARTRLKELKTAADDRVLSEIHSHGWHRFTNAQLELDKLAAAAIETRHHHDAMVDELISHSRELRILNWAIS